MLANTSKLPLLVVLLTIIPTFLLGIYYFVRAAKSSRYDAIAFVVMIVYGLTVERVDIRTIENYDYANLLIMIGASPDWVPVAVGVSWATIIYLSMKSSDMLGLPWFLRPIMDGAFAVWLDLIMDPVSSSSRWVQATNHSCGDRSGSLFGGVGLWQWCVHTGSKTLWFTVPVSNFIGWFAVVAVLSLMLRIGRERLRGDERSLIAQVVLIVALAAAAVCGVIFLANQFIDRFEGTHAQWTIFAFVFGGPLVLVGCYAKRLNFRNPVDLGLLAMPIMVFIAEPATFFIKHIDKDLPNATPLFIAATAGAMLVLFLPYLGRLKSADTA